MRPLFWRRIPGDWRYVLRIFSRRTEDDIDVELRFHFEERVGELIARGARPDPARAQAMAEFGDVDAVRADLNDIDRRMARTQRRAAWWESSAQDLRFAIRGLLRTPAFTLITLLTLALGIGANTAIFSVVNQLLLSPLRYADGNRIVSLNMAPAGNSVHFGVNTEILRLWMARSRTLEEFAASRQGNFHFGNDTAQDSLPGAMITPSFLPMLRVKPVLGTGFTPNDERPGATPVMMISYGIWQTRFGAARDVIGRVMSIDGAPRTIVGVVPSGVDIPILNDHDTTAVWLPLNLDSVTGVNGAFARLRRGATSAAASAELRSIVKLLPDTGWLKAARAEAATARDQVDPREQRAIEVLFAAVSGLLLIACANVANLLFMRAWGRQREFAVRHALGGGRLRLARQLLIENLVLTGSSGALSLLLAWSWLRVIIALRPAGPEQVNVSGVHIGGAVLAWTAALSIATGLLFGIGPTLLAGAHAVGANLRTGTSSVMGSPAARRGRTTIVVGQIALSLIFLAAAGVLTRSFVALMRTPIGYDPAGLAAVHVQLPRQQALVDPAVIAQALTRSLAAVPSVSDVTVGALPQTTIAGSTVVVESATGPRVTDVQLFSATTVGPEYFRVARIPLLQGRGFDATTVAPDSREIVINQTFARRLWPDGNALNARVRLGDAADAPWFTVVGVAGDTRMPGVKDDYWTLQMYRPSAAARRFAGSIVLRAHGNVNALRPAIVRAVEAAGVSAKFQDLQLAEQTAYWALRRPRFAVVLFGLLAAIALVLSAVGLYGVVAFAVAQRTREIGIRMALGAEPRRVARLILGNGLRLTIAGCVVGVIGAYAATRALTALLYGVSPSDPIAFVIAVVLLVTVALIAAFVPMRRALRVDPTESLRSD